MGQCTGRWTDSWRTVAPHKLNEQGGGAPFKRDRGIRQDNKKDTYIRNTLSFGGVHTHTRTPLLQPFYPLTYVLSGKDNSRRWMPKLMKKMKDVAVHTEKQYYRAELGE